MNKKTIVIDNMNPNIIRMQYAVSGPLVIRAAEIEKELAKGIKKPFKEVIRANIGDCQAMGQKPLTFIRQVLALCAHPELLEDDTFPSDVKKRASDILNGCDGHSVGSYTDNAGVKIILIHVAQYIEKRDGIPSDPSNIFLSSGATEIIQIVLHLFNCDNNGKVSGVMVPIPQYPLYSATVAEYGMHLINYYLDEDNGWALSLKELKRAVSEARKVCKPRILVVINPGNPTGSVLTRENIEMIIKFAHEEGLFLMADEVYQDNIYAEGMKFYSFKKVMMEMGEPYKSMELASFMSSSTGYVGECGLRGGYCEIINLDPEVKSMLLKCVSERLSPSTLGQAAMDCVVNPPQPGEPSYDLFIKVGYSVRFENVPSSATKIKFLTDGMLLRETISDPLLSDYSVVILDEAHERTPNSDILFRIVKLTQKLRKDQKQLPLKEKTAVLQSLKQRAMLVVKTLNSMQNMKCNEITGAMYAFPRLFLPEKAIQKAKSLNQAPDFFYTMQLLENTGICVVPGSGFGQVPGTYHFRITILPQAEKLKSVLSQLEKYHVKFLEDYK